MVFMLMMVLGNVRNVLLVCIVQLVMLCLLLSSAKHANMGIISNLTAHACSAAIQHSTKINGIIPVMPAMVIAEIVTAHINLHV